jgi:hypothetical protein
MSRDRLDGRLVTRCDGCGAEIQDSAFTGFPGLTEFLGLGICGQCREARRVDVGELLLRSDLLSEKGRKAVEDFMYLQAPDDIRQLAQLLRGEDDAADELLDGRAN